MYKKDTWWQKKDTENDYKDAQNDHKGTQYDCTEKNDHKQLEHNQKDTIIPKR